MNRAGGGVRLALAIFMLWVSGLCFYIALEGSKILGEGTTGSDMLTSALKNLALNAQTKEQP
jgi:hypothetical protein